jgi:hypothetical protein
MPMPYFPSAQGGFVPDETRGVLAALMPVQDQVLPGQDPPKKKVTGTLYNIFYNDIV